MSCCSIVIPRGAGLFFARASLGVAGVPTFLLLPLMAALAFVLVDGPLRLRRFSAR